MKLFIEEKKGSNKTGRKIYIDKIASTRRELQQLIGTKEFYINGEKYYVSQVKAENASDSTAVGAVVGGVLGLIGGSLGVAVGGAIGLMLGKDKDIKEQEKADTFNGSGL